MSRQAKDINPNKDLGHDAINYLDLNNPEAFKEYKAIEGKLLLNTKYDFDVYKASTITKKVLDDNGNIVSQVTGIQLNGAKRIQQSRMTWKMAQEFNKYVSHDQLSSKYMLLSKAAKEEPQFV